MSSLSLHFTLYLTHRHNLHPQRPSSRGSDSEFIFRYHWNGWQMVDVTIGTTTFLTWLNGLQNIWQLYIYIFFFFKDGVLSPGSCSTTLRSGCFFILYIFWNYYRRQVISRRCASRRITTNTGGPSSVRNTVTTPTLVFANYPFRPWKRGVLYNRTIAHASMTQIQLEVLGYYGV